MSAYQEVKKIIKSKTKDVNIPISNILSQSPIKHNVLSKNQPIRKRKITDVTKEEVPFKKRQFNSWFGKNHNYRNNNNNLLLLPCPAEGCNCGMFINIFDNYDINMKNSLILNSSTEKYESQISWSWRNWNYIGENSKNKNNQ